MLSLLSVSSLPSPGTAAKAPSTRINSSTTSDNQPHRQVSVLCLLRCRPQCPDSGEVVVARHTHPTHTHTCLCLFVTVFMSKSVMFCCCLHLLLYTPVAASHLIRQACVSLLYTLLYVQYTFYIYWTVETLSESCSLLFGPRKLNIEEKLH